MNDHAIALNELPGRVGKPSKAIDLHCDVFEIVAQGDIRRTGPSGVDLGNLARDPRGRPALHRPIEFLAQHADRPGILRGGLCGKPWELVDRPRAVGQVDGSLPGFGGRVGAKTGRGQRCGGRRLARVRVTHCSSHALNYKCGGRWR